MMRALNFTLILTCLIFFSRANAKPDGLCATYLTGFNAVLTPTFGFAAWTLVKTYKAKDNNGHVIVIRSPRFSLEMIYAVQSFPTYFKQFDIWSEGNILIIPDSIRLNSFVMNGLQFEDIPIYKRQEYSNDSFRAAIIKRGKIPLGSRGYYFTHDRMLNHLVGAISLPKFLAEKFYAYAKFEEMLVNHPKFMSPIPFSKQFSPLAYIYDSATAQLGEFINQRAQGDSYEDHELERLTEILVYIDRLFEPHFHDLESLRKKFKDKERHLEQISEIQAFVKVIHPKSTYHSEAFIRKEASKLLQSLYQD